MGQAIDRLQQLFGTRKPVIAMVHMAALPGTPLYDADGGIEAIVNAARADLRNLQLAGTDAVMFGNENDRPYELKADSASTAAMAYTIGRLRSEIRVPLGVEVLWDPMMRIPLNSNTQSGMIPNGRSVNYRSPSPAKAITAGAQRRVAASETPHLPSKCDR